ncbi:MarR family transcriptional regulator [soil metagenome]
MPAHPGPAAPDPAAPDVDFAAMAQWPTGRLLVTAARLAEHAFTAHLAAHDITPAGLSVLHALGDGPHFQHELALRCRVQAQTMSRTVERLERSGFVSRQRDETDRRRLLVHRSGRGRRVYAEIEKADLPVFAGLHEVLDDGSFRQQLLTIIDRLGNARWRV